MIATKTSVMAGLACVAGIALVTATSSMAALISNSTGNGGFESPAAPGAPTGWTLNLSGGSGVTSTAYANSGTQSLVLDSTGAGAWSSPNVFQSFAANPGDEFNFKGYMLRSGPITDASFGLLKMEFRDAANGILLPASASIGNINNPFPGVESTPFLTTANVAVDTWLFTELQGVAPANTATVQFYLLNVNQGIAPGPMYFDDVRAVLIPEPTSLALLGLGLVGLKGLRRRK